MYAHTPYSRANTQRKHASGLTLIIHYIIYVKNSKNLALKLSLWHNIVMSKMIGSSCLEVAMKASWFPQHEHI